MYTVVCCYAQGIGSSTLPVDTKTRGWVFAVTDTHTP